MSTTIVTARADKTDRILMELEKILQQPCKFLYVRKGKLYEKLPGQHELKPLGHADGPAPEIDGNVIFVWYCRRDETEAIIPRWYSEGQAKPGCTWRLVKLGETLLGHEIKEEKVGPVSVDIATHPSAI